MGHLKMMAAAQPFISGAISKTVNCPAPHGRRRFRSLHQAWKLASSVAIYRDGCKQAQPLRRPDRRRQTPPKTIAARNAAALTLAKTTTSTLLRAVRHKLKKSACRSRTSSTSEATKATSSSACIPMEKPGEIFIKMAKEGSTFGPHG